MSVQPPGKRTGRRRSGLIVPAAFLLTVGIASLHYNTGIRPGARPGPPPNLDSHAAEPLALPDSLHTPALSTPAAADAPVGRASVMISGSQPPYFGWGDTNAAALVGPRGLRMSERQPFDEWHPGQSVLLSPDGGRTAYLRYQTGHDLADQLHVQELDSGQTHLATLPARPPAALLNAARGPDGYLPHPEWNLLAWAPDSRQVVIARHSLDGPAPHRKELGLFDIATGGYRKIAITGPGEFFPGFAVAVSADGQRVAYQVAQTLAVVRVDDGEQLMSTRLPVGTLLAGKGAWTPDGRAVAVVVPDDADAPIPRHWRAELVDSATGRRLAGPELPAVSNATVIRAVGWQPGGELVVVAYRPERRADPRDLWDRTSFRHVRRADLLALQRGRAHPVVLLQPPSQHLAIDVAEDAISSGLTFRNPDPPWIYLSRRMTWILTSIGALPLALIFLALLRSSRARTNRQRPLSNR